MQPELAERSSGAGPMPQRPSTVVGALYAAGLAGGCLAALLGAAFLVPVLGIPQTSAVAAPAAVAGCSRWCEVWDNPHTSDVRQNGRSAH